MKQEEIENYKQAGKIAKQVREFASNHVKQDMKLINIAYAIEGKIKELGAEIAFPVNLSLNEIAAHYTPSPGDQTEAKGLLKIDIGTCVNGYIGDTAIAIDLTPDNKHKELIDLNKQLLNSAKEMINPNVEVGDIGSTISNQLENYNKENQTKFNIIAGLTGHALEQDTIHAKPTIPNYTNPNPQKLNDKAFAIEPFLTTGSGKIYEGEGGGIYMLEGTGQVRDREVRKILQYIIENYKTRPFCARWLEDAGFKKITYSLSVLTKQRILHHHPLLIEKTKSPVSQMEHSFLIADDKAICLTG